MRRNHLTMLCHPEPVRHPERSEGSPANGRRSFIAISWRSFASLRMTNLIFLFTLTMCHPQVCCAASADISDIMHNLQKVVEPFYLLLNYVALLMGITFIFKALVLFKKFGQPITQMSQPGEFLTPLVYMIVGSVLLYLPYTANVITTTIFQGSQSSITTLTNQNFTSESTNASSDLLSYSPVGINAQWQDLSTTAMLYISFIG